MASVGRSLLILIEDYIKATHTNITVVASNGSL